MGTYYKCFRKVTLVLQRVVHLDSLVPKCGHIVIFYRLKPSKPLLFFTLHVFLYLLGRESVPKQISLIYFVGRFIINILSLTLT